VALRNGFLGNFFKRSLGNMKDLAILNILNSFNIKYSFAIYEVIKYNPLQQVALLLSTKLGLPKMAVFLIIAFVL
jgi:hypothetical protein